MSIRVPCELCGGCGRRPLTVHQSEIVAAIRIAGRDRDGWCTSSDVSSSLTGEVKVRTSLCNSLVALYRAGVLERRPLAGRVYEWRVNSEALTQAA